MWLSPWFTTFCAGFVEHLAPVSLFASRRELLSSMRRSRWCQSRNTYSQTNLYVFVSVCILPLYMYPTKPQ